MAKPLVIVESKAKADTIAGFLGRDQYTVMPSVGHIRDLPQGAKQAPKSVTKPEVRRLGIDVDDHFRPVYVVPDNKKHVVAELKAALKDASELYLATDEDREGEAISWHLLEVLKPKVPGQADGVPRDHQRGDRRRHRELARPRHEAGRGAGGPSHPRPPRRLRGVERRVPPHRARHVGRTRAERRHAARRRPRARAHGVPQRFLLGPRGHVRRERRSRSPPRSCSSTAVASRSGATSTPTPASSPPTPNVALLDEAGAVALAGRLDDAAVHASRRSRRRTFTEKPKAPFITSTLQQEAGRKLGFSAGRTMSIAQGLYERGLITYMRTDSTSLSEQAVSAARRQIASLYGDDYLPDAAARVPQQGEERAGGARGHPSRG